MKGKLVKSACSPGAEFIIRPNIGETLEYFDPEFFGDEIGWILRLKNGKETFRYNTRYIEMIEWETEA